MEIAVCIMGFGCLALAGWAVKLASKEKSVSKEVWKEAVDVVLRATSIGQKETEEKEKRVRALIEDTVEKLREAAVPPTPYPVSPSPYPNTTGYVGSDRSMGLDDAAVVAGDLGAP